MKESRLVRTDGDRPPARVQESGATRPTSVAGQILELQRRAGNRAVARRVLARAPKAVLQPGYASGDMFGIAAALIRDPQLYVLITTVAAGATPDARDRAASMQTFYQQSGIAAGRIKVVPVDRLSDTDTVKERARDGEWRRQEGLPRFTDGVHPVGYGTRDVAQNFTAGLRTQVRQAWGLGDQRDAQVGAWLAAKGLPTPAVRSGRVLVLWARFTGKKGEIHIEHDTSYAGIRQIVDAAKANYTAIIITGDKSWGPANAGKFATIAAQANQGLPAPKVFDLTEFWTAKGQPPAPGQPAPPEPTLAAWEGHTRTGQFKLYDYLQRHFAEVRHLGFRSGNLEAMALLGFDVRYMEEQAQANDTDALVGARARMEQWHAVDATGKTRAQVDYEAAHAGVASQRVAPGYERLVVSGPPTQSGQYALWYGQHRPRWAPGMAAPNPKPAAITKGHAREDTANYGRGFTADDMVRIRAYLGV